MQIKQSGRCDLAAHKINDQSGRFDFFLSDNHSESCNVRIEATVAAQRLGAAQRLDVLLLRRCLASSGQQPIISLWLPLGTDCNKMTDDASWGFHGPPWGCKRNSKNLLYRTNSI